MRHITKYLLGSMLAVFATGAHAGELMPYTAYSNTAISITGDIQMSAESIVIAGTTYPLTLVRTIDAQQLTEAGKIAGTQNPVSAHFYKLAIPHAAKLVNDNKICGDDVDASWLLAVDNKGANSYDHTLALAFFAGAAEPDLNYDVISKSAGVLCGTFNYGK